MPAPLPVTDNLSLRILKWVLLTALLTGTLLGGVQVVLDAKRASVELDNDASETLAIVRDAATQSVYSIDSTLALQVIDGLFDRAAMRYAGIKHPDDAVLAERYRALSQSGYRVFTDTIFGAERRYVIELTRNSPQPVVYGTLTLSIDTAHEGKLFLERSMVVLLTGLLKSLVLSLVLYVVYHMLLTRPLVYVVNSLTRIDPAEPGESKLTTPPSHQDDEFGLLVGTVNDMLKQIAEHQSRRRSAEARVLKLSQYDPLTGLPNQTLFRTHLTGVLDDARRSNHKVAVFCFGIDDFKSINEQYGYGVGDRLLLAMTDRMLSFQDRLLTAARLGNDQFAVVQYRVLDTFEAANTADMLLRELANAFVLEGHQIHVTVTIGIAMYPDDGDDADKLLQRAEQTSVLAKTVSRNHYQFYVASMDQEIRERRQIEKELQVALAAGQFTLVYQPQLDLEKNGIIGAEALIRWEHPQRGMVPPDYFIPIAERSNLIIDIGNWVMETACLQAVKWRQAGIPLKMSINLSATQIGSAQIVQDIDRILHRTQMDPANLVLEITETSFMENLTHAIEVLSSLRDRGIAIAVDDFGTGYSSLSYLKRLPADYLKIDKQFIRDLLVDDESTAIVRSVIQLGASLHLGVVAEGVETPEQLHYLRSQHCRWGQGYLFSKPLSKSAFEAFWRAATPETASLLSR